MTDEQQIELKKSDLQTRLEAEGWKFLFNTDPRLNYDTGTTMHRMEDGFTMSVNNFPAERYTPRSNEQIRERFLKSGFPEVRIEDAYDCDGNPLKGMRAVYVRGKGKEIKLKEEKTK